MFIPDSRVLAKNNKTCFRSLWWYVLINKNEMISYQNREQTNSIPSGRIIEGNEAN